MGTGGDWGERKRKGVCSRKGEKERAGETKMYREGPLVEEQPSPWARRFRIRARVCLVGTKECWGNLDARAALIRKIYTSVPCPGVQNTTIVKTWNLI